MRSSMGLTLTDAWSDSPEFEGLTRGLRTGSREELIVGLQGSARAFLLAALARVIGRPLFIVSAGELHAERTWQSLTAFTGGGALLVRPSPHLPYEILAESREGEHERLGVLRRLTDGAPFVAVAPLEAVLVRTTPLAVLRDLALTFTQGARWDLSEVSRRLVEMGYDREERVDAAGQFAVRGGIVDVLDPSGEALRVEFFGDQIDSVRRFDPATQRSQDRLEQARVGLAREVIATGEGMKRALPAIERELREQLGRLRSTGHTGTAARLEEHIRHEVATWGSAGTSEGLARFLPYFYPEFATILDYLPADTMVAFEDPDRLHEAAEHLQKESAMRAMALLEEGAILPRQAEIMAGFAQAEAKVKSLQRIDFHLLFKRTATAGLSAVSSFTQRPTEQFAGQWDLFRTEAVRRLGEGTRLLLFTQTEDRVAHLVDTLRSEGFLARASHGVDLPAPGEVVVAVGDPESGFHLPSLHLWVLTEAEILGQVKRRRRVLPSPEPGERISSFLELREGDYVVHVHHGIGRFLGIRTMETGGQKRDYLDLQYAGEDKLFVPTDQIQLVQKYVGQEGHAPRLYRLGGGDWSRVKSRVQESVREMAAGLLRLQAVRMASPGYRCAPDTVWQRQLEESFPYEETPDQLRAMAEIKADLESGRPMDRLLLGDVGYGKTELAIRAAFKLVTEGKQVAVLVPTTILAQQHFQTFSQRMAGFPVEIDLMSRFRTSREQAKTLSRVAEGLCDIVIGTHRLLSKSVRFHDLGLLVIDEEQRFGVQHKERIKELRERVHVLTLTATPIPRTLQMGLLGMKDLSVIDTPPEDRIPVQTYVAEYDGELIRDAIRHELARGGQVYYVYNRVETIDDVFLRLRTLVPEARIAVGHGQMREEQLEETMMRFLEGEEDILLSTTIIESGLDIPNVNTLIVEQADFLGLGQMYQLRGRIGRSNRQAFAYFTYHRDKSLTEEAEKRLEAIRQFTEFGSGYRLAMRDLEIRGAGNILGPEQHGFVVAVGYDLYTQLLEEAVLELKGTPAVEKEFPAVDLSVDAFIPDAYISDERQKIEVYKRIAALSRPGAAEDLLEELADRFGNPPEPVQNLLSIARLRVLGEALGVNAIRQSRSHVQIAFAPGRSLPGVKLAEIGARFKGRAAVTEGNAPEISLRVGEPRGGETLSMVEEVLTFLEDSEASA